MNKIILSFLLSVSCILSLSARDKSKVVCEARWEVEQNEGIVGQPVTLSLVLYASSPVSYVDDFSSFHVKKAEVKGPYQSRSSRISRVNEKGKNWYVSECARYVVTPDATGTLDIPTLTFKAYFRFRQGSSHPFSSFFSSPDYREEVEEVKVKAFKLKVKEKPRRTTKEMMREGRVM